MGKSFWKTAKVVEKTVLACVSHVGKRSRRPIIAEDLTLHQVPPTVAPMVANNTNSDVPPKIKQTLEDKKHRDCEMDMLAKSAKFQLKSNDKKAYETVKWSIFGHCLYL